VDDLTDTTNLVARIDKLLKAGREVDALPLLQQMRRLEPGSIRAAQTIGAILYNAKNFAAAVDALNSCVQLAPNSPDDRLFLAKAAFSSGSLEKAESAALAAIALQPGSSHAIELLARVLLKKEASVDAERRFRDCVLLGSASGEMLADFGAALQNQSKFREAEAKFRRAMAKGPANPEVILSLANCLLMLGKPRAALSCITRLGPGAKNAKLDPLRARADKLAESLSGAAYRDDHPAKKRDLANTRHLIAVCRHSNHLDHLLPILDSWVKQPRHIATMLFGGHVVSADDFRVAHMMNVGIIVARIPELLSAESELGVDALWDILGHSSCESALLCDLGPHPLDLAMATSARAKGIPVVGTPDGEANMLNQMTRKDRYVPGEKEKRTYNHLDAAIFANEVLPHPNLRGSEDGRASVVLGSVRYCQDWLKVLRAIVPALDISVDDGMLRVVVFLVNEIYPVNWGEMARTLQMLLSIPKLCVVVQPHPRLFEPRVGVVNPDRSVTKLLASLREWANGPDGANPESMLIIAEKITYGASLVEWGDVFLSFSTSITYQAIMQRKPVLELSYAHANHTAIAHYLPVTDMRCLDHVWDAIHRIAQAKKERQPLLFYDERQFQTFVRTLIEPGEKSPLEQHVSYFDGLVRRPVATS